MCVHVQVMTVDKESTPDEAPEREELQAKASQTETSIRQIWKSCWKEMVVPELSKYLKVPPSCYTGRRSRLPYLPNL